MTPSPILKALSTLRTSRVRFLLMGGQACVLYGAAEFSRDAIERQVKKRPLLALARDGRTEDLDAALWEEERLEREADRAYWLPLKKELEQLRHGRRKRKQ